MCAHELESHRNAAKCDAHYFVQVEKRFLTLSLVDRAGRSFCPRYSISQSCGKNGRGGLRRLGRLKFCAYPLLMVFLREFICCTLSRTMDTIKYLWELINSYPPTVKWLAGLWMVMTAVLAAALVIKRPTPAFPASVTIRVIGLELSDKQWNSGTAQLTVDNKAYDVYQGAEISLPRFSTADSVAGVSITSLHPTIRVRVRARSKDGKQKEFVSASKPLPKPGQSLVINLHPIEDHTLQDDTGGSVRVLTEE
jgi:hypothetical protein